MTKRKAKEEAPSAFNEENGQEEYSSESDDGSEMSSEEDQPPPPPPQKKLRQSKVPTVEEMKEYKEIENLHHSSLFRMQIKELLYEMKFGLVKSQRIEKSIEQLKTFLLALPQGEKYNLAEQHWIKDLDIKVPLIQEPQQVRGTFCFFPPKNVCITGSFLQRTAIKNRSNIDIAVEMPQKFYQMKDFMNHRYIRKRALYLVTIASHLKKQDFVEEDMKFAYHHGNHFKPVLIVSLKDSKGKSCQVNLHAVPAAETFQLSRFHFSKNNVRNSWFYGNNSTEDKKDDDDEQQLQPTALHNMAVMSDMVMLNNFQSVEEAFGSDNSQLKDGIILLKIWLHQRQLSLGYGAFSTYIMSMFVIYLLMKKKLNNLMSSYQIFRSTLYHLGNSDWTGKGISLASTEKLQDSNLSKTEDFKEFFDVVFVDFTGFLNLTANMSKFTYYEAKQEANITLKALDSQKSDTFETVFMKSAPFHLRYDQLFHVTDLSPFEKEAKKPEFSRQFLDLGAHYIHTMASSVTSFLQKILKHRISHVQMKPIVVPEWSISEKPPWVSHISTLTFGISIIEEFAYSVIEKGPIANLPEAKEFREFWGEKSELRKFKDGSICEAVLWTEGTTMAHKRNICSQIISYMLNKVYSIFPKNIFFMENKFNSILADSTQKENYGTGEEENLKIINAYDKMCKILRKCDLPIEIKDIQSISPVLRFSEVFPMQPAQYSNCSEKLNERMVPNPEKSCPSFCPHITVLCMMGVSKRNIDDLDVLKRLKALCHLQLHQILKKDFYLPMTCNQEFLDVLLSGYVFRIKMCFSREIDLLQPTINSSNHSSESLALWGQMRLLPKLTNLLHSLGQQFACFSAVVRLAKRWISSQMLLEYLPEVAVELIVANLFISPEPYQVPKSPVTGFGRFLQFLSTFDWETTPLFVNLNEEFSEADIVEITKKFNSARESLPPMCICTSVDVECPSFWTLNNPNRMLLGRLRSIAKLSWSILDQKLTEPTKQNDFKIIFRISLEPYDVILYLENRQIGNSQQAIDAKPKSNQDKRLLTNNLPVVSYEPNRLFLKDLKNAFSDIALFFDDCYGSNVIGLVWKPNIFNPKPFKVSECNMQMVQNSSSNGKNQLQTVPNIEAIIEDIKILGKGILHSVKIKTTSLLT